MIPDTLKNHTRLALEQASVKISTTSGFKVTGLAVRFESLFEKWPQPINQQIAENWGQIKLPFPLSELAAILEPATLTLTKQPNTNPATGGARVGCVLRTFCQCR
jgi:hypothetical protein